MNLPPFGKIFLDYNRNYDRFFDVETKTIWIFVGQHSFNTARHFSDLVSNSLCLPPYLSPFIYHWPVKDIECWVIDTGYCNEDYINEIAKCLMYFGSPKVNYLDKEISVTSFKLKRE